MLATMAASGAMAQGTPACAAARAASTASRLSLDLASAAAGDTVRTVRLCLFPTPGVRVGSFHVALEYDSTLVRAVHFVPAPMGAEVANLTRAGRADIAGAAPGGFTPGSLLQLDFAPVRGRAASAAPGTMTLRLLELNATSGATLVEHTDVVGIAERREAVRRPVARAALKAPAAPRIDRLDPARAAIVPGGLVPVIIHGSGFRPEGNVVLFAGVAMAELRSDDGKTLRFLLPDAFPAKGEVPPQRIGAGNFDIRVRTIAGTSNRIALTLESPR